ncbi:MAG: lytic polysaccharide monooxygenase [Archangium sp.]
MRMLLGCVVLLAVPALAHSRLEAPVSFQMTDSLGNPQKTGPCGGAGTASGVVTTVVAGSQLTINWTETIAHPGYFRIGIAQMSSEFVTPVPVLTANGTNCSTSPTQSNPTYPILVDGLFQHSSSANGTPYSTTITVPMMSCDNCMLQLMQFMSSHPPPCYYYQCAALKIVMPDAGSPAVDAGTDAGMMPADAGQSDAGPMGGGAGGGSGGGAGGGSGGGTSQACGPANCQGCCGADGTCQPGNSDATCGAGGALCLACTGDNACMTGQCTAAPTGCGCGVAPFGLLVLVPFAFFRRRRVGAR